MDGMQTWIQKSIVYGLFTFFAVPSLGAPIPGTSSSALTTKKHELFRSTQGFEMHAGNTSWYIQGPTTTSKSIETIYKSPKLQKGLQASLTIRVDQKDPKVSFKQYLKKSLKDYARLGMEILKSQPIKVNETTGFLVDAVGQNREKQIRQLVFGRGQTMVILTCRDRREFFKDTIKNCNEIFKSFTWL
tara:strand:- start:1429 stop:1992 length:564 start_codon:yes stop_codon:yes gene_type:complete